MFIWKIKKKIIIIVYINLYVEIKKTQRFQRENCSSENKLYPILNHKIVW